MTLAAVRARLPVYRKPVILGLSVFGCVLLAWLLFILPASPTFKSKVGFDAYAYWVVDPLHPYLVKLGELGSFTYSPAFAQILGPVHLLPFYVFFALWDTFLFLNLVWLTRRYAPAWLVFLPVSIELFHGNVHLLLATVCVLGFEYPALWSIGILTKVTPGVSLLWFVVRREWRSLGWALGATAAISAVSFVIAPGAWFDWVRFLTTSNDTGAGANDWYAFLFPPLALRVVLAAALIVWGARTDRRWVVPVATVVAMPVIWVTTPAVLMAIPRLRGKPRAGPDTISSIRPQALDSSQSSQGALAGES
ncbi:MAG TPA: glycosyltransferase family 87 protein [Candidatus Limnocylindrales bacterium]